MPRLLSCLLLLLLSFPPIAVQAESVQRVGRYTAIAMIPTDAERDPLAQIVTLRFPVRVRTVGDAIGHTLTGSGYRLSSLERPDVQQLLSLPLPDVHRELGPMSMSTALTTLAGSPWRLVSDPQHRLVTFELTDDWLALQRSPEPAAFTADPAPPADPAAMYR